MKTTRYLIIMLLMSIFFAGAQITIFSAEESTNQISLSDMTIYPGNSGYVSVNLQNQTTIAGLSFEIYYDSEVFSISNWNADGNISEENISVNNDVAGKISISIISLDGIDYSGNIFNLYFISNYNAPIDDYLLDLAILDAYDLDLNQISFTSNDGMIQVIERETQVQRIYLYSSISDNELYQDDSFQYRVYSWNMENLAAGNFEIYYDKNTLLLQSVELAQSFESLNPLISVNTDTPGFINISFAAVDGITYGGDMLYVNFEVISDQQQLSDIVLKSKNLYNVDLEPLVASDSTISVPVYETIVVIDNPDIYVSDYVGSYLQDFTIDVGIEATSHLAAGDFVIQYNTALMEVIDIQIGDQITSNGGYLEYNPIYDQGEIRFSYINVDGLTVEDVFFEITFSPIDLHDVTESQITISGSGIVDDLFNPLELDFQSSSVLLTKVTTIRFIDYDESILSQSAIYEGEDINYPNDPERVGTTFSSWQLYSQEEGLTVYKAVYVLNDDIVTLSDNTITYDGNTHSLEATGLISGVSIEYSNNSHTDAGTYEATANVYLDDVFQFALTATLTIDSLEIAIILDDNTLLYGEGIETSFTVSPTIDSEELNITFLSLDGIGAGTHEISATIFNSNYIATVTNATLTINPAPLTITADDKTSVYGEAFVDLTYTIEGNLYDELTIYLEKAPGTSAGTYEITVSASNSNYDITLVNGTYTIAKADYDMSSVTFEDQTIEYDGNSHTIYLSGTLPAGVTVVYVNTDHTNLGEYTITATFVGDWNNYNFIQNMSATMKIIEGTISGVSFDDATFTYNGHSQMISVESEPEGASVVYDSEGESDVGKYLITATVSKYGYNDLVLSATLTITKADLTIIANDASSDHGEELSDLTYVIQGTVYNEDNLNIVLTKEEGTDCGTYTISVTASNDNYQITVIDGTYTIYGMDIDISGISFNDLSSVYNGEEQSLIILNVLPEGILGVNYVNNTLTDVGETIALVSFVVGPEYNPLDNMVATLTITKADIIGVELIGGDFTYDGSEKAACLSNTMTQYGDSFEIQEITDLSYINAGEYNVSVILTSANYNRLTLNALINIAKADRAISEADFNITYTDSTISITSEDLADYTYLAVDGGNYNHLTTITGLSENTSYEIDIYIGETQNYNISNIITINITTYQSWATFTALYNGISIDLNSREVILELIQMKDNLDPTRLTEAESNINNLIDDYNDFIASIQAEYELAEGIMSNLKPSYSVVTLLLFGLAAVDETRWRR